MNHSRDSFWNGGAAAWRRGLREAICAANERIESAASEEDRNEAQAALERLNKQQADAKKNRRRWLF